MLLPRSQLKVVTTAIAAIVLLYVAFQWRHFPAWPTSISSPFNNHNTTKLKPVNAGYKDVDLPKDSYREKPSVANLDTSSYNASALVHDTSSYNASDIGQDTSVHNSSDLVHHTLGQNASKISQSTSSSNASDLLYDTDAQIKFWRSFQSLLASNRPDAALPSQLQSVSATGFNPTNPPPRPSFLSMPDEDIEKMRKAHTNLVHKLNSDPPKMVYVPGSRGIVSTAGGPYLPVLVISLRMLRQTGSSLPMEVFLADHREYESYICEEVLPTLNAKCVVLSDILDSAPKTVTVTHYQYKVFALLFSSFENILFLDSDSFPMHDPAELLDSEPFLSHGLVTWPDFWAGSASPLFYNITSQIIPSLAARASTESGEILLSKKTHYRSLLLATYYNYYGPGLYYTLLSQGAPGEGDKETFLAAASVFNDSSYQTSERVRAIGHFKANGELGGSAMVQYDPVGDYLLTEQGLWRVKDEKVSDPPRPFFVHANFPRFNPATIFSKPDVIQDTNGQYQRAWTDTKDTIATFGFDLERRFWDQIKWVSCELEGKFKSWESQDQGICDNAKSYWKAVFETP